MARQSRRRAGGCYSTGELSRFKKSMTPRRSRKGGIVLRFLLAIVLLIALGTGAAYFSLTIPYRAFAKPVILDFPRGTSTAEMANQLAQSGVIRYPWQFLIVRILRPDA